MTDENTKAKGNDGADGSPKLDWLVRLFFKMIGKPKDCLCPRCGFPTWGNVNFRKGEAYTYCYRIECGHMRFHKSNDKMSLKKGD